MSQPEFVPPQIDYFRGDLVYAARDLYNDGPQPDGSSGLPESEPGALLAAAGTRGMIVNVGHPEVDPSAVIYLVSFETGEDRELGLPFGCLPEELTQDEELARRHGRATATTQTVDAESIHGHAILRWLTAAPISRGALGDRVRADFGPAARFHTCDVGDLSFDALFDLLVSRGKIVEANGLWSAEPAKICSDE
jgi:nitrogen fixation protein NifZ